MRPVSQERGKTAHTRDRTQTDLAASLNLNCPKKQRNGPAILAECGARAALNCKILFHAQALAWWSRQTASIYERPSLRRRLDRLAALDTSPRAKEYCGSIVVAAAIDRYVSTYLCRNSAKS